MGFDDTIKHINFSSETYNEIYVSNNYRGAYKYDICDKIGEGTFGSVYTVKNCKTNDIHVMKVTSQSANENHNEIKKLLKIVSLSQYSKYFPEIYQIYDCYANFYIIMEQLNGSLDHEKWITLSRTNKKTAITHLLRGLYFIHRNGIVFNDLKSENISFSKRDGKIKIIDFGLASFVDDAKQYTCGTPTHMPPESFRGIISNDKKDIWSLGITLWKCMTNTIITHDILEVKNGKIIYLFNELSYIIDDIRDIAHKYEFGEIVIKCLTINYKERPSTIDLLQLDIFKKYSPNPRLKLKRPKSSTIIGKLFNTSKRRNNSTKIDRRLI